MGETLGELNSILRSHVHFEFLWLNPRLLIKLLLDFPFNLVFLLPWRGLKLQFSTNTIIVCYQLFSSLVENLCWWWKYEYSKQLGGSVFYFSTMCGVIIFINALLWQTQKGSCARTLVLSVSLNIRRAPFMCAKTAYAAAASLSSQF